MEKLLEDLDWYKQLHKSDLKAFDELKSQLIDKACEWLLQHTSCCTPEIERFKKYMGK